MPITSLLCPSCKKQVPTDHFADSECGLTTAHPDYVAAVLAHEAAQPTDKVRVTSGLGCPRSAAIMIAEDVAVDPCALNAPLGGTAWHGLMEMHGGETEIEVAGVLDGIEVTGHIDSVLRVGGVLVICDWKVVNDFQRKYLSKPKETHIVQLSIYAELYRQTFGERPDYGVIWYRFATSPPFLPGRVGLWPIEQCLDYRPHDGGYRVRDLYAQMRGFLGEQCERCLGSGANPLDFTASCVRCDGEGVVNRTPWQELPLVGQTQSFGSKDMCSYCAVRQVCMEQATGAGW
jgi:PD-(D/E)XK nuclease superfamily